ncbi:hypothetical protein T439DRAFT_351807 [Meredithblackwellia eburnea MCA 4105]
MVPSHHNISDTTTHPNGSGVIKLAFPLLTTEGQLGSAEWGTAESPSALPVVDSCSHGLTLLSHLDNNVIYFIQRAVGGRPGWLGITMGMQAPIRQADLRTTGPEMTMKAEASF